MSETQYNSSMTKLTGMSGQTMLHMAMVRAVNERVKSDELKKLYESVVNNKLNREEVYPKLDVYCAKVKNRINVPKDVLEEYIVAGYGNVQITKDGVVCQLNDRHFAKNLHNRIAQVKPIFEPNSVWYCNYKEVLESIWYAGATMIQVEDQKVMPSPVERTEQLESVSAADDSGTVEYICGVQLDGLTIAKRQNYKTFSLLRTVTLLGSDEYQLYGKASYKF